MIQIPLRIGEEQFLQGQRECATVAIFLFAADHVSPLVQ
jgi:hypothetical protein